MATVDGRAGWEREQAEPVTRRRADLDYELVARSREGRRITDALSELRRGKGTALVVVGGPGTGKSAVLARARRLSEGLPFVSVPGCADERHQAGALLERVLAELARSSGRLVRAGGMDESFSGQGFGAVRRLGTALLVAAEAHGPLVLLVDDLQLADEVSAEAVLFAARRLAALPVLLVVSYSTRGGTRLSLAGIEQLVLDDLPDAHARELIVRRSETEVTEEVAGALTAATGGNPLALVEALERLEPGVLAGRVALPRPFPAGPRLRAAFAPSLAGLEPECLTALCALALADRPVSLAELAELGVRPEVLDPAVQQGLLVERSKGLAFGHPALAAVAAVSVPPATRRSVAEALARSRGDSAPAPAGESGGFEVRLLDGFGVRAGGLDHQVSGAAGKLVRLVALRGAITVDAAAEDLFGGSGPGLSRARVRDALDRLDALGLGDLVVRDGELLRVADEAAVDVRNFETAAELALWAAESAMPDAALLAADAAALYRGELLPADHQMAWTTEPRIRLRQLSERLSAVAEGHEVRAR